MYVAVKGGERAIENAHKLLAEDRRGDPDVPELTVEQISRQLSHAVSRVMTEGSVHDRELAALAIKQARGDLVEAIYLIRAFRTTLPRFTYSQPLETEKTAIERRISATFRDLPGGQILGPTFDYTHRLLDFGLLEGEGDGDGGAAEDVDTGERVAPRVPRVIASMLQDEEVIQPELPPEDEAQTPVGDLTRQPPDYPVDRDVRLQNLSRADEGFLLSLAYSTMRGYGDNHAFVGELRCGEVPVEIVPEELGFPIEIGSVYISECETVNQFRGTNQEMPQFTRGYGISFGHCERKVIAMAVLDRALRARELGEDIVAPAQDEEFVLTHSDSTQAAGFVEHIKLPHYGGFQAEREFIKRLRRELQAEAEAREPDDAPVATPAEAAE